MSNITYGFDCKLNLTLRGSKAIYEISVLVTGARELSDKEILAIVMDDLKETIKIAKIND